MNINELVKKHGFRFSKKYGQNFIGDDNLLSAIISDAGICAEDCVVEIGAGAGTLTKQAAKKADFVIAFEIDKSLKPILNETLADCRNTELIFGDIMDYDAARIDEIVGCPFKVVANLPYYITTPVLFKLLECKNLKSATVMVQKEVAQRICASENTAEYGALSVAIQLISEPVITRIVNRECFVPAPNVDSAIVRMDIMRRESKAAPELISKLVKCAFAMRRKTLANNLTSGMGMNRAEVEAALTKANLPLMVRGEALSVEKFVELAEILQETRMC